MSAPPSELRAVIADVVRELGAEMAAGTAPPALAASPGVMPGGMPVAAGRVEGPARIETVRIGDDADLDRFARRLLTLFDNPKNRDDLRAGRLRFRLQGGAVGTPSGDRPAVRVEAGAVTERQVKAAAESGRRIVLGPRAVLTPLGRERARALGVPIEKER